MNTGANISRPSGFLILTMYLATLCLPALAIPLIAEAGLYAGGGFSITDSDEKDIKKILFKNSYKLLATSVIWAASAAWLIGVDVYGAAVLL
ncbi:MAG: hypothetical protein ABII64_06915 [Elusimicrobiota bacterium]